MVIEKTREESRTYVRIRRKSNNSDKYINNRNMTGFENDNSRVHGNGNSNHANGKKIIERDKMNLTKSTYDSNNNISDKFSEVLLKLPSLPHEDYDFHKQRTLTKISPPGVNESTQTELLGFEIEQIVQQVESLGYDHSSKEKTGCLGGKKNSNKNGRRDKQHHYDAQKSSKKEKLSTQEKSLTQEKSSTQEESSTQEKSSKQHESSRVHQESEVAINSQNINRKKEPKEVKTTNNQSKSKGNNQSKKQSKKKQEKTPVEIVNDVVVPQAENLTGLAGGGMKYR